MLMLMKVKTVRVHVRFCFGYEKKNGKKEKEEITDKNKKAKVIWSWPKDHIVPTHLIKGSDFDYI